MGLVINNIVKFALKPNLNGYQVRFYPRWSHRRPVKVYTPEEYDEMEKPTASNSDTIFKPKFRISPKEDRTSKTSTQESLNFKIKQKNHVQPLIATKQKSKVKAAPTVDMLQTVIDADGNFVYTKMGNIDHRVGSILSEIKSKKEKDKKDLILLEGKRLIKEALQSGCSLKYIIFSRKDEVEYLKPHLPKIGATLYKMPYREMQLWSDLTTNPGIMGVFKTPEVQNFTPKECIPVTIICDNVREPGNLGAILRVAAGVGCAKVILTKGCVNLWDSKVLRSSVGAHFKLALQKNIDLGEIEKIVGDESRYFIADNKVVSDADQDSLRGALEKILCIPYYSVDFRPFKHTVIVIGGETCGISQESYELAAKKQGIRLNIPLVNDIDSLNVGAALGIIVFEIRKQLLEKN